jgi:hypothetical protein
MDGAIVPYDCPIHFGADTAEFRIPNETLDVPRTMSNTQMFQICEERCQAILERLGSGGQKLRHDPSPRATLHAHTLC